MLPSRWPWVDAEASSSQVAGTERAVKTRLICQIGTGQTEPNVGASNSLMFSSGLWLGGKKAQEKSKSQDNTMHTSLH